MQLGRKELFKNTLRKAAHAWKRIIELKLSGLDFDSILLVRRNCFCGFFAYFVLFLDRGGSW